MKQRQTKKSGVAVWCTVVCRVAQRMDVLPSLHARAAGLYLVSKVEVSRTA